MNRSDGNFSLSFSLKRFLLLVYFGDFSKCEICVCVCDGEHFENAATFFQIMLDGTLFQQTHRQFVC